MNFRRFLLNLTVGFSALLFGIAWVGLYQFFLGQKLGNENKPVVIKNLKNVEFDINNSESVLPIDFEAEKLTSPTIDETNEAMFDPEGYYYFEGSPKGFENFLFFSINNKNFADDPNDKKYGELVPLNGHITLGDEKGVEYIDFDKIRIFDGKINFETKTQSGISYKFDGEFLITGNFYTLGENVNVLAGTLVKKENGKTAAKKNLNFKWDLEIGCLH